MSTYVGDGIDDFQLKIVKALGMPETTFQWTISCEAGSLSRGSCEFYVTEEMMKRFQEAYEEDAVKKGRLLRRMDDG